MVVQVKVVQQLVEVELVKQVNKVLLQELLIQTMDKVVEAVRVQILLLRLAYAGGAGGGGYAGGPTGANNNGGAASPCGTGGQGKPHTNGTANRGGGGGGNGGGDGDSNAPHGTGGSGIVVIRYKFQ